MSVRTQRNSLPLICLNFKKTLLVEDWYEYFRDDFDDAILRPEWITHGLSTDKTIEEASDIITFAITNNADARWWCTNNVGPKMYMPLEVIGPCRITTKLLFMGDGVDDDPPGESPDDTFAGIFIGTNPLGTDAPSPPYTAYRWGRYNSVGGNDLRVRDNCGSFGAMVDCSAGCLPRYFMINIDAAQVITFYWKILEGDAWTQYDPDPGGAPVTIPNGHPAYDIPNCYVGLFAINTDGNANLSATFEYFLIEVYEAQNPTEEECLAPIDTRAPTTFYSGRIKQMSSLKRAVDDKTGLFQIADMSMTLANEDKHYSQKMASRFLKNQEAILYHAWTEEPDADKIEVIKLIVEDHSMKGPDFIVKFKDITQKYFTKKVPENICTKDEFPNIHPNYEGWCMPEILGNASLSAAYEHPGAVQAVYVDMNNGNPPFRCLASAGTIFIPPVDEVWIADVPKQEGVDYDIVFLGGRTYIDFRAAQDPGDDTVAFNAHGYSVPLWDSANGYIQNLAYIIQYYLRFLMDIPHALVNSPSFVTLAGYYEYMGVDENCYLVLQDRVDGMEVLRELLFTGGAKGFMAMDGKFNVARKNICNWEITPGGPAHIFEQIELFDSPHRQWNLTSAINTVNVEFGLIPWQDLYTGAKSEYKDNRYERPMEDGIRRDRPRRMRR